VREYVQSALRATNQESVHQAASDGVITRKECDLLFNLEGGGWAGWPYSPSAPGHSGRMASILNRNWEHRGSEVVHKACRQQKGHQRVLVLPIDGRGVQRFQSSGESMIAPGSPACSRTSSNSKSTPR
jgi:hypothetical protein